MDFDGAIWAHAEWKMKLATYLKKPDGTLKAAEVGADHKCALGQWIHGTAPKEVVNKADLAALKAEHSRFHKAAAEVVRKADAKQDVTEEIVLGGKSEFAKASMAVISAIRTIKSHAR